MKIEVLFPEFCNLFGDAYNMVYLEFSDDVRFTEEKMNLVYMGPMTERMQEQVIRKLMPLKEKIQKAIDDGTVFLFTGNALEIFGDYIENEDGSRVECLGLYRLYATLRANLTAMSSWALRRSSRWPTRRMNRTACS